jgi:hypothetical protein
VLLRRGLWWLVAVIAACTAAVVVNFLLGR